MEQLAGMRTFGLIIFWFCGTAAVVAYCGIWTLLLAMTCFLHGRSTHPAVEAAFITAVTLAVLGVRRSLRELSRRRY